MTKFLVKTRVLLLTVMVGLIASSSALAAATIVIQNNDQPGVGFNDPTPVAPVGGNNGSTLGEQRLNAFQFAANIWGATLNSGPPITVRASWPGLPCTATSGTLALAGAVNIRRDFPGALFAATWYSVAIANSLSGSDLNGPTAEISARFNVNVGTTGCLESRQWYYGLDTNPGINRINLVTVLLHEFSHGLGFQTFTDEETGARPSELPTIYDRFLFDNTTGKTWVEMTNAERVASAINTGNLVWNGSQVTNDAATV
ncbi:MAG: peptidase, partial [Acidobacteria bacterium]|nr:peptidase [Acidobacteriota bacterium]